MFGLGSWSWRLGGVREFRKLTRYMGRKKTPNFPSRYGWVGYYKGNRCGSLGTHTKKGHYRLKRVKVPIVEIPDGMDTCELKPYVSWDTPKVNVPSQDKF
eukprot:Plantae.Rhodophyta-Purpureofilum_apyrenoidigerum.ctg10922.p1 GENE.Plantae.Rhodophyta-Purpureofilum_apyrenoidigerum.ctg10922~~Plantae.Rhodophyta-Purpureofilum_apyrenoidigerum.ctg10922.p1  ORF type:complete len:100 (+),score=5.45 Plantae.Rhodophyta-Purpureofilum_apyrenoidigerum.ctg10922:246-545(+)